MSADRLDLSWSPPGPVASRFMASAAQVQVLNGPVGSGKTTACLMKGTALAARQMVSTRDSMADARGVRRPVRKFRLCVVRDTYRQLWKTTLPSWFKRIPREIGTFTGADNAPASHRLGFQLGDGTMVDFQADFVGIGDNTAEDALRGYEPTAFYLNEADLLARDVFTYAAGRTGRFPDMAEGGPSWHGVLMDCNAPELSSWLYRDVFAQPPEALAAMGLELFRQPSGLGPHAENLANLPPGYYTAQARLQPEWYVQRMLEDRPGYSRAGKPIYPEFNDQMHVPDREPVAIPELALLIGLDAGLSPAAVIAQRLPGGGWVILAELAAEQGTGAVRFAEALAKLLHDRFAACRTVRAWADPSAQYGADKQAGERTWIELVEHHAGIRVDAAPTNALIPRLEAVRRPLTRLIDGKPAFALAASCMVLREGFNAGYRYRRHGATETFAEEPEKNRYSHPHDALQYVLSAGGEDAEIHDRRGRRGREQLEIAHEHDWQPFAA